MNGEYPVWLDSQKCGSVQVHSQGLYYRFFCRCQLQSQKIFRLEVHCGPVRKELGIPVPVKDGFALEKRIPVKYFGTEEPRFLLILKKDKAEMKFVPVYPEEPFAYISRVKENYLIRQNGQLGIMV